MKILDAYVLLQDAIFEYFGYVENWRVIPLQDNHEFYWRILGGEAHGGSVRFAQTPEGLDDDNVCYEDEIYTQRHLSKWVYRGPEYTMICVDTHTDLNTFLRIFENAKERTEAEEDAP